MNSIVLNETSFLNKSWLSRQHQNTEPFCVHTQCGLKHAKQPTLRMETGEQKGQWSNQ